jgi:beta-mannosidase
MLNQSLESGWSLYEPRTKTWLAATVPGCVHTDLRRQGLIPDPFWGANEHEVQWIEENDWIYRCEFEVGAELLANAEVELVAECLDTVATIRLNGTEIGRTANMFVSHRFGVKEALKPGGNVLEIEFLSPMKYIRARRPETEGREWNDPVGGASFIRKEQCSFGWDWGPRFATSGIAGKIRLEAWNVNRIERVRVRQEHSQGRVKLELEPELARRGTAGRVKATLRYEGDVVAETNGMVIEIAEPKLWWPNTLGEQALYSLEVALMGDEGEVIDLWEKRIGLRTIALDRHPDEYGESFQFVVNGKAVFAKGANWIPAHSFITEATPELYRELIDSAARANMNMMRVWGGGIYETELFYDLCDERGCWYGRILCSPARCIPGAMNSWT